MIGFDVLLWGVRYLPGGVARSGEDMLTRCIDSSTACGLETKLIAQHYFSYTKRLRAALGARHWNYVRNDHALAPRTRMLRSLCLRNLTVRDPREISRVVQVARVRDTAVDDNESFARGFRNRPRVQRRTVISARCGRQRRRADAPAESRSSSLTTVRSTEPQARLTVSPARTHGVAVIHQPNRPPRRAKRRAPRRARRCLLSRCR